MRRIYPWGKGGVIGCLVRRAQKARNALPLALHQLNPLLNYGKFSKRKLHTEGWAREAPISDCCGLRKIWPYTRPQSLCVAPLPLIGGGGSEPREAERGGKAREAKVKEAFLSK